MMCNWIADRMTIKHALNNLENLWQGLGDKN